MDHKTEQAEIAKLFLLRLTALMEREGLDPEKGEHLAIFVGVSKNTGYNWLTPGKTPSARTLKKIAQAFDVSSDYLLGLTDDQGPCRGGSASDAAQRAAGIVRRGP